MRANDYVKLATVTESKDFAAISRRFDDVDTIRLCHAMIGLCTEAGEFQDAVKKSLFYGKTLDRTNLAEELGDIMWYVAIACDTLGVNLEDVMEKNIAKLKARYGDKFTEQAALNRDLETERKILEG
jgi:NTP pyrophosphatase (non-canonical NTP hydrolase)